MAGERRYLAHRHGHQLMQFRGKARMNESAACGSGRCPADLTQPTSFVTAPLR